MLLAVASLVLYLLLGQDAFHGVDAHEFLQRLGRGDTAHRYHFLYLPLVDALCRLLAPFGVSIYGGALAASALGTAAGVWCVHRAAGLLGLHRGSAALAGALCATAPAVLFFATVVEVHGVFYAFAGAGWWAAARLVAQPTAPRAAVLGLATGVAATAHATGHLLLPLALLVWLVLARPRHALGTRRIVTAAAVAAAVHALVVLAAGAWLRPGERAPLGDQIAMLQRSLVSGASPGRYVEIVWNEWLLAYLPISVVAFAGLLVRARRALALAVLGGLVAYLAAVSALLIHYGANERGAYLMPLAFPCALLTVALLPRAGAVAAVLAALVVGTSAVGEHDRPGRSDAWARGLLEATAPHTPLLWIGDVEEARALMRVDARVPWLNPVELVPHLPPATDAAGEERAAAALFDLFDARVARAAADGMVLVFSDSARTAMAGPGFAPFARLMHEHVPAQFALERLARGPFQGWAVRPRDGR